MDDRANAARFRRTSSLIAHPKDLALRRPRRTRGAAAHELGTSWLSVAVGIGLVTVVALSVALAVSFGRDQRIAFGTSTIVRSHLGSGYPEHHGLAGPSRVGQSAGSWLGYPPHYGLAGPSHVDDGG